MEERAFRLMLRRLFAEFVRWIVKRWAEGQLKLAKKKADWEKQAKGFKDAAKKWRDKR